MIPCQYQKVTDEKCLQLQKVSLTHTNTHIRTSAPRATITQQRLGPISAPQCVKGIGLTCSYVCVWPQWSQIRGGYGKHRLKHWIMEKLI